MLAVRLAPGAPARCQRNQTIETFQSDVHLIDFKGPPANSNDKLVVHVDRTRAFCAHEGQLLMCADA